MAALYLPIIRMATMRSNEDDWPVVAKFHAKWSLKLYEAIVVPYLKPVYAETEQS